LIVLDTLRADRLSCYGHPEETSPNLDAFAEKGVFFERAISPAQWTIPAHGSLFTGELPSAHGTTQIYNKHTTEYPTLAEYLNGAGYETVGFCNNPLLGVVDNDLDRGFADFYNYGGVLPTRPVPSERGARWFLTVRNWLYRQINRLNEPVQELLTHNDAILGFFMQPWLVPLWERNIHFKGNSHQSIHDLLGYLKRHRQKEEARPLFAYLNLMETHLPYSPAAQFSHRFAPSFHKDREAKAFMKAFNHKSYEWITPITEPFTERQHRVLNEMYNAEVAYEDHLLHPLLDFLDKPEIRDNTLVIITSDHGEGLDHHNYVGHSLVAYEDLVRVPLMLRYPPRYPDHTRVSTPVSTRRIFHTVMEAAGLSGSVAPPPDEEPAIAALSLRHLSAAGPEPAATGTEPPWVYTEAYPPLTMVNLIEQRNPEAVQAFRCRETRRAVYEGDHKLITVGETAEELYNVRDDPAELINRLDAMPELARHLDRRLKIGIAEAHARRPSHLPQTDVKLGENQRVSERLRRLGYIE
jgi:uncharacterized sulfatase